MKRNQLAYTVAAAALAVALTGEANALTISINAGAGLTGNAAALAAFNRAADAWEAIFSDPITVNVDADLLNLGNSTVIGSSTTVTLQDSYTAMRNMMVADAADEASNGVVAHLPTALQFTASVPSGFSAGSVILASKANMKALGYNAGLLDSTYGAKDATINFNTSFMFDFDNSDGVSGGTKDFETVAIHELGHALGFLSVVDQIDFGLNNGTTGVTPPTTLDLFRFNAASSPNSNATFEVATRELRPGQAAVFDDLANEYAMSTGDFTGDGNQASHWRADEKPGGTYIGIFDPTLGNGVVSPITAADIRALDLIGWDVRTVAEPASIAAFVFGLGALGMAARRRQNG